jgi:hypothetical protein
MNDQKLIQVCRAFREGLLDGASSEAMCFVVASSLSGFLSAHGVKTEVVEGSLGVMNHFWLRLPDGRILDPTADQFNTLELSPPLTSEILPDIYLGPALSIHPERSS